MEVSNASLYDGGTALFEAMMMATRIQEARRAVLSLAVSPIFREMIRCYSRNLDVELVEVPPGDHAESSQDAIINAIDDKTACVLVQYPNVFGAIEDWSGVGREGPRQKALAVCSTYPLSLAILRRPARWASIS